MVEKRKASGRVSITVEAVDEALLGWIDGCAKASMPRATKIRFTPRRRPATGARSTFADERAYARASRSTCWVEGFSETSAGDRAFIVMKIGNQRR